MSEMVEAGGVGFGEELLVYDGTRWSRGWRRVCWVWVDLHCIAMCIMTG
jgi:hypothetical protein